MAQNKTNVISIAALIASVAALGVSLFMLCNKPEPAQVAVNETEATPAQEEFAQDIQYVLYVGTNDKDTNEPVLAPEEAREQLEGILTDHFYGFTIQEARGGWLNDDGSVAHEYTLVVYLSDTTLDEVHAACDGLVTAFNQSSILIQQNVTSTEFYSGT